MITFKSRLWENGFFFFFFFVNRCRGIYLTGCILHGAFKPAQASLTNVLCFHWPEGFCLDFVPLQLSQLNGGCREMASIIEVFNSNVTRFHLAAFSPPWCLLQACRGGGSGGLFSRTFSWRQMQGDTIVSSATSPCTWTLSLQLVSSWAQAQSTADCNYSSSSLYLIRANADCT